MTLRGSRWFMAAVLLPVAFVARLQAQSDVEFTGYVVDFPVYQYIKPDLATLLQSFPGEQSFDRNQFVNLTRLRLRPKVRPWDGATLMLEYEADMQYQTGTLPFGDAVDRTNRQVVDLKWHPYTGDHLQVYHYIDRLWLRQNFDFGNIVVGRQRISWGTGRVWNPTDMFVPINPANYEKIEKDGADVAALQLYFGNFTDLTLVYNPMPNADSSNFGARLRTNVDTYDISVMGGFFDRRIVVGADFAGSIGGAGVRGEGILSMPNDDVSTQDIVTLRAPGFPPMRATSGARYFKFILGADYQFTPELYALAEYLYNGEGNADGEYDLMRFLLGEAITLARDYVYVSANYLVHPLVYVTGGVNQNLNDGSGFVNLTATWSSSNESAVALGGLFSYGGTFDEYWYYPASVYLRGELYF